MYYGASSDVYEFAYILYLYKGTAPVAFSVLCMPVCVCVCVCVETYMYLDIYTYNIYIYIYIYTHIIYIYIYISAIPKSSSDWLVKKIQNRKQNFIIRNSHITALLLHMVAIHIKALVVP